MLEQMEIGSTGWCGARLLWERCCSSGFIIPPDPVFPIPQAEALVEKRRRAAFPQTGGGPRLRNRKEEFLPSGYDRGLSRSYGNKGIS